MAERRIPILTIAAIVGIICALVPIIFAQATKAIDVELFIFLFVVPPINFFLGAGLAALVLWMARIAAERGMLMHVFFAILVFPAGIIFGVILSPLISAFFPYPFAIFYIFVHPVATLVAFVFGLIFVVFLGMLVNRQYAFLIGAVIVPLLITSGTITIETLAEPRAPQDVMAAQIDKIVATRDVSKCRALSFDQQICVQRIAIATEDFTLCKQLITIHSRNDCYAMYAAGVRDTQACRYIVRDYMNSARKLQEQCVQAVGTLTERLGPSPLRFKSIPTSIKCTDSDGGINPKVAGTTTGVIVWRDPVPENIKEEHDYCSTACPGSVGVGPESFGSVINESGPCLVEFYCASHPQYGGPPVFVAHVMETCPCKNGACMSD